MQPNADLCPTRFVEALDRYVNHGMRPGGFLTAVLSNDLIEAFNRADEEAVGAIPHLVCYIYNRLPSNVWGDTEKVNAFVASQLNRNTKGTKKGGGS